MWWYGRGNSCGSWLSEEKKANMWPGRGNSGGSWPPAFPGSLDTTVSLHSFLTIINEKHTDFFAVDDQTRV